MNLEKRVELLESSKVRKKTTVKDMTDDELIRVISADVPGFQTMGYNKQMEALACLGRGCQYPGERG